MAVDKLKAQGFTLIELMIAMTLGLLVSGAAVVMVMSALGQLSNSQHFSEIVDNGRIALEMMERDIAHAGFMGPLSGQELKSGGLDENLSLQVARPAFDCKGGGVNNQTFPKTSATATFRLLWGEEVSRTVPMPCIKTAKARDEAIVYNHARIGSDLIQIKRLVGNADTRINPSSADPELVYMVANASAGVIYQHANQPSAFNLPSSPAYYAYQHRVYYVAEVNRYGEDKFPVLVRMSLHYLDGKTQLVAQEIAEGIEDIRILYGIDSDANATVDHYVTAANVAEEEWDNVGWNRIISVKLALLIRATKPDPKFRTTAKSQTYSYAGERRSFTADGIRRKVLETTIGLKNHQIINGL